MGRNINSGLSNGAHGQMTLENYELHSRLNSQQLSSNRGYLLRSKIHPHKLPMTNQTPNSTQIQRDDKGKVVRIRYYDEKGNAYKDVDYTDHNRPDVHKVPHTHIIEIGNKIDRKKGVLPYDNRRIQQFSHI